MISASRIASTAAHVTPGYRLGSCGNEERFDRCSSAGADMDSQPTAAGQTTPTAVLPCRAGPRANSRLQTAELEGGVRKPTALSRSVTGASTWNRPCCVRTTRRRRPQGLWHVTPSRAVPRSGSSVHAGP